jgi:hypothetical protein
MRRVSLLAVFALVFVACSSNGERVSKSAGLPARNTKVEDVEVTVTPSRLDATGATFSVVLDTHSGSLDVDIAKNATLTVGGAAWTNPTWNGDGPGGHHRSGTLAFTAAGPPTKNVTLTLAGFADPVVMRWPS